MLDPWTFTASAQRMREHNLRKVPLNIAPRVLPMRSALLVTAGLTLAAAVVVYGGMWFCVTVFA